MKRCTTESGQHKWKFDHNITRDASTTGVGQIKQILGRYKCTHCSAWKNGNPA